MFLRTTNEQLCVCVCARTFIEAYKKHALCDWNWWALCFGRLTPDVLEQNTDPQYCSGCRWQNRNPFILTAEYLVWLIKVAALLYSPGYRNVFLICDTAQILALYYVVHDQHLKLTILTGFGHIRKIAKKWLLALPCPSVRMLQFGPHCTDFHEIWYFSIVRKHVEKIRVSSKSDKNDYFTRRPI
jgi:hypothetical protein